MSARVKALARFFERLRDIVDVHTPPRSRLAFGARVAMHAAAAVVAFQVLVRATRPLLAAPAPKPIPGVESGDRKFGLPKTSRQAIFQAFAVIELAERHRAISQNTWNGEVGKDWSREDDRGWGEHMKARQLGAIYGVGIGQIYLVLDEGLREHWLSPNGQPLPATTPPLQLRNEW